MFLVSRGGGQEQFAEQFAYQNANHHHKEKKSFAESNPSTITHRTNTMHTMNIFKFKFVGEHTKYMAHASKKELSKLNLNDVENLKKLTEPLEPSHTHTYYLTIKYSYGLFDYEDVKQYFEQLVAEKKLSFDNKPLSAILHDVSNAVTEYVDYSYRNSIWYSIDIMEDDTHGLSLSYIK